MPAIVTHHIFGTEVYAALSEVIGAGNEERDAFLLGNHGPDPLLFLKVLPGRPWFRGLGGLMHSQRPSDVLFSLHERFVRQGGSPESPAYVDGVLVAYALGFLCHYLLDSAVHPLVFAQQRAFCDSGLEGLTREHDWHNIHFLIEAELDEYVLASKLGVTVREFPPHCEILKCQEGPLMRVSSAYSDMAYALYRRRAPKSLFATGVWLYRLAQLMFDLRRSDAGRRCDYARLAGRYYPLVDALTHSGVLRCASPFANDDHVPWPHHHNEGEVVSESFDELYARAFARSLDLVPRFASEDVALANCQAITRGLNFSGKRVEERAEGLSAAI